MPPNTIYVGRPTVWGNPFTAHDKEWNGEKIEPKTLVMLYEIMWVELKLNDPKLFKEAMKQLRGKNLACWCKPKDDCHADVLLRLANQ